MKNTSGFVSVNGREPWSGSWCMAHCHLYVDAGSTVGNQIELLFSSTIKNRAGDEALFIAGGKVELLGSSARLLGLV